MANEPYEESLERRIQTLKAENESVLEANRRLDNEVKRLNGLLAKFVGGESNGEPWPPELTS